MFWIFLKRCASLQTEYVHNNFQGLIMWHFLLYMFNFYSNPTRYITLSILYSPLGGKVFILLQVQGGICPGYIRCAINEWINLTDAYVKMWGNTKYCFLENSQITKAFKGQASKTAMVLNISGLISLWTNQTKYSPIFANLRTSSTENVCLVLLSC